MMRLPLRGKIGDVAVLEEHETVGDVRQRKRVRREKRFRAAQPDHERRAVPRADHAPRFELQNTAIA